MANEVVCWACEVAKRGGSSAGLEHTCPQSGTWLAQEGRDAGEDTPVSLGSYSVSLHFRIRATDELAARQKLTGLVADLLDDDLVQTAEVFVTDEVPV